MKHLWIHVFILHLSLFSAARVSEKWIGEFLREESIGIKRLVPHSQFQPLRTPVKTPRWWQGFWKDCSWRRKGQKQTVSATVYMLVLFYALLLVSVINCGPVITIIFLPWQEDCSHPLIRCPARLFDRSLTNPKFLNI